MKRRRLKKWVIRLIDIIMLLLIALIMFCIAKESIRRFEVKAKHCDEVIGRTCSYQEIVRMYRGE